LLLDEQFRSAIGGVGTHDRLLRLDIQSGRHTRLELLEGNDGCVVLSAHIFAKVLQYGIESLDYTINGDADQVLVLTGRVTQLVRQTGEGLEENLRIELVRWRTFVAENGSEAVAQQVLTALVELMNVVELKRDGRLRIRYQVLAYQIDARLLDHKIGLTEKKLEE
jgi:hypothetical protein